jgi:hypothetical protein
MGVDLPAFTFYHLWFRHSIIKSVMGPYMLLQVYKISAHKEYAECIRALYILVSIL